MTKGKILFLGPEDSSLLAWLQGQGERVIQTSDKVTTKFLNDEELTFLISYGYRHILGKEVLSKFPDRAINLHISYLPWNRGADPNLWSFVEDSPKGVTIHYLDEGVDTGDIIVQKKMEFDSDSETLATSYEKLQSAMQKLFKLNWNEVRNGSCKRKKQIGQGSSHRLKDKDSVCRLLTDGWNTPVFVVEICAAETQVSMRFWEKYDFEIAEIQKQEMA